MAKASLPESRVWGRVGRVYLCHAQNQKHRSRDYCQFAKAMRRINTPAPHPRGKIHHAMRAHSPSPHLPWRQGGSWVEWQATRFELGFVFRESSILQTLISHSFTEPQYNMR